MTEIRAEFNDLTGDDYEPTIPVTSTRKNNVIILPKASPIKKRERKSLVWEEFKIVKKISDGTNNSQYIDVDEKYIPNDWKNNDSFYKKCKTCANIIFSRNSSSTTLRRHIETSHEKATGLLDKMLKQDTYPLPTKNQIEAICKHMIRESLPFNYVSSESFIEMLDAFGIKVHIPSRNTVVKHIHSLYEKEKVNIMMELSKIKNNSVMISYDTWTSKNGTPFLDVTVHYLDDVNWKIVSILLSFTEFIPPHNATRQMNAIIEVLNYMNLTQKAYILIN